MKTFITLLTVLFTTSLVTASYLSESWKEPRPNKPDLTVTFIERLPRYRGVKYTYEHIENDPELGTGDLLPPKPEDSDHKRWPDPGDTVTFIAHVKNAGATNTLPFDWYWTIDGKETASGVTVSGLAPGAERAFTTKWTWADGDHYVAFDVNRRRLDNEITRKNNVIVDQINGLAFHFFVEQGLADWFTTVQNGKGSYCWEDWAQMQVQEMNRTFRSDIHPTTPEGITLRVRLDRIFVISNGWGDPEGMHTPGVVVPVNCNAPELRPWWEKTNEALNVEVYNNSNTGCDGVWGFTTGYLKPDPDHGGSNAYERLPHWIIGPEWSLLHELGHQLGLHDYYLTPVNKDQNLAAPGVGFKGTKDYRSQMMHSGNYAHDDNIGKGKGRWDCNYRFWEEGAANALSKDRERRRGMFGWFIDKAPTVNTVIFIREDGTPIKDAAVSFYRPKGMGYTNPQIPEKPAITGVTDKKGRWEFPEKPFKEAFNWGSNGTFFFIVKDKGKKRTGWLTYNDLNLEYYRGKTTGIYYCITAPYPPEKSK